ncbi:hypothetical protein [Yinghuangia seranimata]|uniref:hypothetical protein n=1 Tax=Yinghuangia seranimata TaxID=408067 RepID=UPI00248B00FA|nr:hypothetical protein [Yinghuangia seranimata]MDI2128746.1 hypothetical protein [Yinghuangia seranimata]
MPATDPAARHIRVRLLGTDPDTLTRAAELLATIADTGPVSASYANRRGDGHRLYLDLYLPADDPAPGGAP